MHNLTIEFGKFKRTVIISNTKDSKHYDIGVITAANPELAEAALLKAKTSFIAEFGATIVEVVKEEVKPKVKRKSRKKVVEAVVVEDEQVEEVVVETPVEAPMELETYGEDAPDEVETVVVELDNEPADLIDLTK